MSRITINEAVKGFLKGITDETELQDENGRILGLFVPLSEQYAKADAIFPEDENARRIREEMKDRSHWMTTPEAISFLENHR
jgi:hypothetical protein